MFISGDRLLSDCDENDNVCGADRVDSPIEEDMMTKDSSFGLIWAKVLPPEGTFLNIHVTSPSGACRFPLFTDLSLRSPKDHTQCPLSDHLRPALQ